MNRKDYIVKCISSAAFLASSSFVFEEEKKHILSATQRMIEECWKMEYQSYLRTGNDDTVKLQIKFFWDEISSELYCKQYVDLDVWYQNIVDYPDNKGNVEIRFRPNYSLEWIVIKIKGIEKPKNVVYIKKDEMKSSDNVETQGWYKCSDCRIDLESYGSFLKCPVCHRKYAYKSLRDYWDINKIPDKLDIFPKPGIFMDRW